MGQQNFQWIFRWNFRMTLLVLLISLPSSFVFAQGGLEGTYQIIIKKQEEKKRKRWTIYDWLNIKAKMKLQDQWLAMNTSDTVFEMFLGGEFLSGTTDLADALTTTDSLESLRGEAGFYYRIFGVEGGYTDFADDSFEHDYALKLRLLGTGIQNSNLTLGYGQRNRNQDLNNVGDKFENQFAEASLQFYVFWFFGLSADYRHYFESDSENGIPIAGHRKEASAFFEFSFVRLTLSVYEEVLEADQSGGSVGFGNNGWNLGARLYF